MDKKIKTLLKGKYGIDELNRFLIGTYLICFILAILLKSIFFFILEAFILFIIFYRMMSKKTYIRVKENRIYKDIEGKIKQPFRDLKLRLTDRKNLYRKCPKCHQLIKMKLPKKMGIKHTTCPRCKTRFRLFTIRTK